MDKIGLYMCLVLVAISMRPDEGIAADVEGCPANLPDSDLLAVYEESMCYHFVHEEETWAEARSNCHKLNGDMLKLDNPDLNRWVIKQINDIGWRNEDIWIGLHDRRDEGSWRWESRDFEQGEAVDWTNWARGRPSSNWFVQLRDCVYMDHDRGFRWHEAVCDAPIWQYRYICQYDYNPPGGANGPSAIGQQASSSSKDHTPAYVGFGVGLFLLLVIIIIILIFIITRRRRKKSTTAAGASQTPIQLSSVASGQNNQAFTHDVIQNEYLTAQTGMAHANPTYDNHPKESPPSYTEGDAHLYSNTYDHAAALPTKQTAE